MLDDITEMNMAACPFCGEDLALVAVDGQHGLTMTMVECGSCGAFGPESFIHEAGVDPDDPVPMSAREQAISKWNAAEARMNERVSMEIEPGWALNSADFSRQAAGHISSGQVLLVRDAENREKWLANAPEDPTYLGYPLLHVDGRGATLTEAITSANLAARKAGPVPDGGPK